MFDELYMIVKCKAKFRCRQSFEGYQKSMKDVINNHDLGKNWCSDEEGQDVIDQLKQIIFK